MFERVTIHASDLQASEAFYRTVLGEWGQFALSSDPPVTRRLHVAFAVASRADVDDFWRRGTEAGYQDDGAPGLRPQYGPDYYGGFLLDPDGNSVEAVHGAGDAAPGTIDHLWIRVPDLDRARDFYEPLAAEAGFKVGWTHDDPPRVGFKAPGASFSLVLDGPPTEGLDIEF